MSVADGATERLRAVYRIPTTTPREPLERALAEACRRHRAAPGDVRVTIEAAPDDVTAASLAIATRLPRSTEDRGRDALLRDVETILAETTPGAWERIGVEHVAD